MEGVPEGWTEVGYRVPELGEYYLDNEGSLCESYGHVDGNHLIVTMAKPRADVGGVYWYVNSFGDKHVSEDYRTNVDNSLYECSNYYLKETDCDEASIRVKRAFG